MNAIEADVENMPSVAIACSGLGHIQRGIEAWASDLAKALRVRGVAASLFAGERTAGAVALPCLRRNSHSSALLADAFRHLGGWRYGFGSTYEVEQTTFAFQLWHRIRRAFDILHVQDPVVASILSRLHRLGLSRPRVIFANGTGERAEMLKRYSAVQHLTPEEARDFALYRPSNQATFAIPNFVDITTFSAGDQGRARQRFSIPHEAFVFLCCAAIRKAHKRIDHLIREFVRFLKNSDAHALLIVAGGRESDSNEIIAMARAVAGDRVRFLVNLPRTEMPDLYRAADVFVLPSLYEQFGIVWLEAMATGLPVICNDVPSFRTIVDGAGLFRDLSTEGALAEALSVMRFSSCREMFAKAARSHDSLRS